MLIICPNCGRRANGPDGAIGKTATCPGCHKRFSVSGEGVSAITSASVPADSPPAVPRQSVRGRGIGTVIAILGFVVLLVAVTASNLLLWLDQRQLSHRIEQLERTLTVATSPSDGASSLSGKPVELSSWRQLSMGIDPSKVKQLLGEPTPVESLGSKLLWTYIYRADPLGASKIRTGTVEFSQVWGGEVRDYRLDISVVRWTEP